MTEADLNRLTQIGVIGASESNLPQADDEKRRWLTQSEEVGREIAIVGAVLISGGTDGIMRSSAKGATESGGLTVGTPGRDRGNSNPYIKIEINTPIDTGDYLFAGIPSCDSVIVFPGGAGTLAEVALAYRYKKPMIIMRGYDDYYDGLIGTKMDKSEDKLSFLSAESPKEAVEVAMKEAVKYKLEYEK